MNTEAAARVINDHAANPTHNRIFVGQVANQTPTVFTLHWNQTDPELVITLCYTDPSGTPTDAWDDRTPVLVNDLDIVLISPDGLSRQPFRLDPLNPAAPATTGNNNVDNVKQIRVANPQPGPYTLTLACAAPVQQGPQVYSLIQTGGVPVPPAPIVRIIGPDQPYEQAFLAGLPLGAEGWSYQSSIGGRIHHTGASLTMDSVAIPGTFTLNTATLHANLSAFAPGAPVTLEVDWHDLNDDTHTLPLTHNGLGVGDGVSVSANGVTWHRIGNLHSDTFEEPQRLRINLDAVLPGLGITYGPHLRFRFSQYDDQPSPADGIQIDAVRIYRRTERGSFQFFSTNILHDDAFPTAWVRVDRNGGSDGAAAISWFTRPLNAVPGTDYIHETGTLDFASGEDSVTLGLGILNNPAATVPRHFEVVLHSPTGGATLGANRRNQIMLFPANLPSQLRSDPAALRPAIVHGSAPVVQTLRVWNDKGYGTPPFQISANVPWIQTELMAQGDAARPTLYRITYDTSQLPPGRHLGEILIEQLSTPFPIQAIPVNLSLGWPGQSIELAAQHAGSIAIPGAGSTSGAGPAAVYPILFQANQSNARISRARLAMEGLSHTRPNDLVIVLTAPDGRSALIHSDTAGRLTPQATELDLILSDFTGSTVPRWLFSPSLTGIFRPTIHDEGDFDVLPAPAPPTPGRTLSDLAGGSVTGTWRLYINDDSDNETGALDTARLTLETLDLADGHYMSLKADTPHELSGQAVLLTPADDPGGYLLARSGIAGIPDSLKTTVSITPPVNGYTQINLPSGVSIPFFGQLYQSLAIGHNGDVVFGTAPSTSGPATAANFHALPRVAAHFGALNTFRGGSIAYGYNGQSIWVQWSNMLDTVTLNRVNFGVRIFYDGRIQMLIPPSPAAAGISGVSRGWGSSTFSNPTDFAALPSPLLEIRGYTINPGGSCEIHWTTVQGFQYVLEWSNDLTTWNPVVTKTGASGDATGHVFPDPGDGTRIFLRVRQPGGF